MFRGNRCFIPIARHVSFANATRCDQVHLDTLSRPDVLTALQYQNSALGETTTDHYSCVHQRVYERHGVLNLFHLSRTRTCRRAHTAWQCRHSALGRNHHRSPFYSPREEAKVKFQARQPLVQELSELFLLGLQVGLHLPEGLRLLLGAGSHWQSRHKASPGFP